MYESLPWARKDRWLHPADLRGFCDSTVWYTLPHMFKSPSPTQAYYWGINCWAVCLAALETSRLCKILINLHTEEKLNNILPIKSDLENLICMVNRVSQTFLNNLTECPRSILILTFILFQDLLWV